MPFWIESDLSSYQVVPILDEDGNSLLDEEGFELEDQLLSSQTYSIWTETQI